MQWIGGATDSAEGVTLLSMPRIKDLYWGMQSFSLDTLPLHQIRFEENYVVTLATISEILN